jgi:hypothetical protein
MTLVWRAAPSGADFTVILTALVIWAFSFESQDLIHPSRFSLLVLVHGLVMFTWVGLFLTQVTFVVWHRPRGIAGSG